MHIGDRVRFLNQTGGGIIAGFDKQGRALVEDEDGFQIPVPRKECVVVEENAIGGSPSASGTESPEPGKRPADAADGNSGPYGPQSRNASAAASSGGETRILQTRDGDRPAIALIYTRQEDEFECILANAGNYHLLATYLVRNEQGCFTRFAGMLLPFERKPLFRFGIRELNEFSRKVLLRALPYKEGRPAPLMPVIEKELILDPVNLLKDSSFKENQYHSGKGYVIDILDRTREEETGSACSDALRKQLQEKFRSDAAPQRTAAARRPFPGDSDASREGSGHRKTGGRRDPETIEIDLHAGQLLETTAGMSNGDILNYQLDKFREAMSAHLNRKGTRLIFIHGKGDGVLRAAILKELRNQYGRCSWQDASFKDYGFGATLVIIR